MIYTVTLSPAVDRTVSVPGFALGQVNRAVQTRMDAGGKGINVSKWVHALGGEGVAMGIVGGDTGRFIADALAEEGIRTDFVWADAPTRTNVKVVDPEAGSFTDINEPGAPVSEGLLGQVLVRLLSCIAPGDLVVLAGKVPPGAPLSLLADWTRQCQAAGASVFLDAEGEAFAQAVRKRPSLVKPNEHELAAYLGRPVESLAAVARAARALLAEGIETVAVSLGERGLLYARGASLWHAPALQVEVAGTAGAGDATVAGLAFAQAQGLSPMDAMRLAVACGAASVMQTGTGAAPRELIVSLQKQVSITKITEITDS